jgi:hypothetical protein
MTNGGRVDFAVEYELRQLVHRAAEAQNRGAVEEFAGLFAHGEIILPGVDRAYGGASGARSFLHHFIHYDANGARADPEQVFATTRATQYIASFEAHLDETGSPSATSRFIVLQQRGPHVDAILGGRYVDAFARLGERFCFRRRITEIDLLGDCAEYLSSNPWLR